MEIGFDTITNSIRWPIALYCKPVRGWKAFEILLYYTFQIMDEIRQHGIHLYDFPECDQDEDEDFMNLTKSLKVRIW